MPENDRDIFKTDIRDIDRACQEQFLPTGKRELALLRERGVRFSGTSILKNRYEIKRQSYGWHLLLYTLDGRGWIRIGNDTVVVKEGQLWTCPAGLPHHYGLKGKSWRILWISLKDIPLWSSVHDIGNRVSGTLLGSMLVNAMEGILWEVRTRALYGEKAIHLYTEQILLYLERELQLDSDRSRLELLDKLNVLFENVSNHLSQTWSVAALAKASELYVSPAHFSRLCRKHLGKTPIQIVKQTRLEKTEQLLTHTDYSLELISRLVGYESSFSLSTAFKCRYHKSPREYRGKYSL
jgi:AraC-like DNA-binding protein/quercetin dioxygenase-like cupin family protein